MTSDCSSEDSRAVLPEQPALRAGESVMDSIAEVDLGTRCQLSAPLAGPAENTQMPPARRRREWRPPSVPSSVTVLRWELRAFLDNSGLSPEEVEDLMLATCEATTNAMEHAQHSTEPFFEVAVQIIDDVVTIVVRDHGQWRSPTSSPHRGRGLAMMRVLADTEVAVGAHGTTVTLRTRCRGAATLAEGEERAS
jgi:anti-sigma regulatory factor (Ser/Thr protein kinase)